MYLQQNLEKEIKLTNDVVKYTNEIILQDDKEVSDLASIGEVSDVVFDEINNNLNQTIELVNNEINLNQINSNESDQVDKEINSNLNINQINEPIDNQVINEINDNNDSINNQTNEINNNNQLDEEFTEELSDYNYDHEPIREIDQCDDGFIVLFPNHEEEPIDMNIHSNHSKPEPINNNSESLSNDTSTEISNPTYQ